MSPISVVIAGYARSPFHFARKGALVDIRPDDLAAAVLKGLVEKLDLDLRCWRTWSWAAPIRRRNRA